MKQYLDLMRHAYENGAHKGDRTGTGTRSIFGHQMRFDLTQGFPLLTTKKMFVRGMIDELNWFISGSTNANDLPEQSKHWWTPWANSDGSLGPIYGEQYNASRWFFKVRPTSYEYVPFEGEIIRDVKKKDFSDVHELLYPTWHRMMTRCYMPSHVAYHRYGGVGVHVCKEWHSFDRFCKDVQSLEGWLLKKEYPKEYSLDKDIKEMSNRYCKESCIWASDKEQVLNTSTNRPLIGTSPEGIEYFFANSGDAAERFGLGAGNIFHVASGARREHKGWKFRYVDEEDGYVFRFREVNQLKRLIAGIKHDPDSRRHMVNLWHTPAMEHANLPCCHGSVIQMYVANGKLSCQVYQRSADIFLGVPVNIASYSLLTHMLAQQCDLEVGEFIWTGGDCHLYSNHIEQAELQMSREPRALPKLVIKRKPESIFDYKIDDFELVGYDPHPAIKGEVAV